MRLEPVTEEHLPLLVELNADPEVMRWLLGRPATPEETAAEWRQRLERQSDPARGLGYWAGFEDDAFLGWWSASSFAHDPSLAGLGYRLARSAWGRGLATEGARAMVARAFAVPDVTRVGATTRAANTGSRRVLSKAGLRHVDTDDGEVAYVLTREEWAARDD
ncbi:GNAT family N-acetyltransferase [Nocardioides anomalus]|uniref:GNAT family N-acetyltransferase n=1 Tax=Nocardioides anomalus TaxID=2712223 RepID=A0A6G6W8F3_9ACTN|nr:GNAT family N-acetyltransferase [Nocardioides anomalus]QIG41433.1 GNAT family N-acetyltransferase [Nocardioides anomalus]